ncbi:MAG TPA: cation:dicarboxylase symporter family transporter [Allosphingosinicella sp.]|nr:cation:dicarboxylase symporter family transporter [Allosphingosinicella sp.]
MSQATRILTGLIAGLLLGIASAAWASGFAANAVPVFDTIGGLWLDSLRMTIIPLVVALLVTGIAASAEAARASRLAGRAILFYVLFLWVSAILAAVVVPILLRLFPLPAGSAAALKAALSGAGGKVGEIPTFAQFVRSIVPANPIASAAGDQILPLIFFTTAFAFALTRLAAETRALLVTFFRGIADAMLVIINWVLLLGPIGVFALAYVVGAKAGGGAFGALIHYILIVSSCGVIVWFSAWPMAMIGGRVGFLDFTRAVGPAHAVAISTQSSLASLPAMLKGAEKLGVPVSASGVTLPLAVAIFRATGPAMNLAVVLYIAHWYGMQLTATQIAAGIAVAAMTEIGSVSLPGAISYIASIAPICIAMGVPIEPLVLFVAVEMLPDLVRTVGNVATDTAAATLLARHSGYGPEEAASGGDAILKEDPAASA